MLPGDDGSGNWNQQMLFTAAIAAVVVGVGGYYRYRSTPKLQGMEYFKDKVVIVTGANSGVGFHAAEQLAGYGAKVVLACRDEARAAKAAGDILFRNSSANIRVELLDVSNLDSIAQFAKRIDRCHLLINNAGVMNGELEYFPNGIEKTYMTNYIGPWQLTRLLLPVLARTSVQDKVEVRVLTVGSRSEKFSSIGPEYSQHGESALAAALQGPSKSKPYSTWASYSNAKLANMIFAVELDRRLPSLLKEERRRLGLKEDDSASPFPKVISNLVTPGICDTSLPRHLSPFMATVTAPLRAIVLKSAKQGGAELVYGALQTGVSGKFFGEGKETPMSDHCRSPELGGALWNHTESIVSKLIKDGRIA